MKREILIIFLLIVSGLLLPFKKLFAQSKPNMPSLECTIQDYAKSQALASPNWILEEGVHALKVADLLRGDWKDAKMINLSLDPIFKMRDHHAYWINLHLSSNIKVDGAGLVLKHEGDCWPFEYTFKVAEAFYYREGQLVRRGFSGTSFKSSERDFPKIIDPTILKIDLEEKEQQNIWIKLVRAEACNLSLHLELNSSELINQPRLASTMMNVSNVAYGIILALFSITALLFFWFREKVYLWYIILLLFLFLAQAAQLYRNELFSLIFQNHPRFFVLLGSIFSIVWIATLFVFGRLYINTKQKFPRIHLLIKWLLISLLILSTVSVIARTILLPYSEIIFVVRKPIIGLILFSFLLILIYFLTTKDKLARIYSAGVLLPFASIFFVLIEMNLISENKRNVTLLIMGGMITTTTMALAFRFRMEILNKKSALEDKLTVEQQNSEQLQKINIASNKFVPQTFLNFLGKQNILEATLGDFVEKQVTVLFSDIRDYTALSESMTPEENFKFVTSFNRRIGPVITRHQGFINQYLGDGIMAIFPKSATKTLEGAIAIQKNLSEYNVARMAGNKMPIRLGIGLHSGSLIMGIIGDEDRLDAATISDTVNVASRIEGLNKIFGSSLLLSEDCYYKIKNKSLFHFRFLGKVIVKGKSTPIGIYECFDGDDPKDQELKTVTLVDFKKGLSYYFKQQFSASISSLTKVVAQNPKDIPARLFLDKARRCLADPDGGQWSEVEIIDTK